MRRADQGRTAPLADVLPHTIWPKANAVWNRDQRANEDILIEVATLVNAERMSC